MASGQDRYTNVIGKELGPNWRILKWWKVTIRKPFTNGRDGHIDDEFYFTEETTADTFKLGAAAKYPKWDVWKSDVYVLSGNGGKTGHELPGHSPVQPRQTARLQQIYEPDFAPGK